MISDVMRNIEISELNDESQNSTNNLDCGLILNSV